MSPVDDMRQKAITTALQAWRQGDCVLGEHWFVFRTSLQSPLTEDGAAAASEDLDLAEADVIGFVVLTQTCDLVRDCALRPFVEVAPLIDVSAAKLREVERCQRPNQAFIAGVADRSLVADLDRVMTIEKSVLAEWLRVPGCLNDSDARRFAAALGRKRSRSAFPDDFVAFSSPLAKLLSGKHDKDSPVGRALRALREVRVRAAPSWGSDAVSLTFWFVRNDDQSSFEAKRWDEHLVSWERLIAASGRFSEVAAMVVTLDDLTARDYVESDPFDLDHLSTRG